MGGPSAEDGYSCRLPLFTSQGYNDATYNLALMRAYGRGCAQDFRRAILLFQNVRLTAADA